jgi:(1->4)-alpha-D-glucan 1-alpha-D-glucosylmutase
MAKGLEDTAYYVHNSLISMNEVGGDPLRDPPPLGVAAFHRFHEERAKCWPYTMNATSTHDTKRSEDMRARINVLAEIPDEWEKRLLRWQRTNRKYKRKVNDIFVPAPGEEVLLYQTLLGAWPFNPEERESFRARIQEFLKKAVREAKVYSGWIRQDEAHENALFEFGVQMLQPGAESFRKDFLQFQRKVAWHGALNALSQVLLKITVPGIPDFYQGTELWDFSLVDPDNRRPVDFAERVETLHEVRRKRSENLKSLLRELVKNWTDGRIKLFLTNQALEFRRANPDLYLEGSYLLLESAGPREQCVCAFARKLDGTWAVTVAPRLTTRLVPTGRLPVGKTAWKDTSILLPKGAPNEWRNVLTGESLAVAEGPEGRKMLPMASVLKRFPVALLSAGNPHS